VLLLDEWLSGLSASELEGGISVVWSLAAQGIAVILVEHVMTAVRALCPDAGTGRLLGSRPVRRSRHSFEGLSGD
jgi:ABC-type sugar transport system ATPase subunit